MAWVALGLALGLVVAVIRASGLKSKVTKLETERDALADSLEAALNAHGQLDGARDQEVGGLRGKLEQCRSNIYDLPESGFSRDLVLDELDRLLQAKAP